MRKLLRVITVGAFLAALAFASAANAQSLGQIAGPVPVGTQASFNGAKCVLRAHQYHANRTLRIRRDDGTIVAHWQGPTSAGNDYVLMASFFQLGGAGSRAVCEAYPVNVYRPTFDSPVVADSQITLQTLSWYGNTIETVTGVSGNTGPDGPTLPGVIFDLQ